MKDALSAVAGAVSSTVVAAGAAAAYLVSPSYPSATDTIHAPIQQSGPKAADAPGITAGGQATDKYGNKIGPSGQPQVDKTKSNTREEAGNRARGQGSGAVEHKRDKNMGPHFHPADPSGEKKPNSVHHEYPE